MNWRAANETLFSCRTLLQFFSTTRAWQSILPKTGLGQRRNWRHCNGPHTSRIITPRAFPFPFPFAFRVDCGSQILHRGTDVQSNFPTSERFLEGGKFRRWGCSGEERNLKRRGARGRHLPFVKTTAVRVRPPASANSVDRHTKYLCPLCSCSALLRTPVQSTCLAVRWGQGSINDSLRYRENSVLISLCHVCIGISEQI